MPGPSDDVGPGVAARKNAWAQTLEEMESLAAELEADGWTVVTVPSGHTAPQPPDVGADDRFGLVVVVPGDVAEELADTFEPGRFARYDAFRQVVSGRVFYLLQLLDPETETAVLIAGGYSRADAEPLAAAAAERGELFTHVQKLDGTHVGSVRHETPAKLLPHLED